MAFAENDDSLVYKDPFYTRPHVQLTGWLMQLRSDSIWGASLHSLGTNFRGLERIGWERLWLGRKEFPEPERWRAKYPRSKQDEEDCTQYLRDHRAITAIWDYYVEERWDDPDKLPDVWRYEYLSHGYNTDFEWRVWAAPFIDEGIETMIDAYCAGVPIEDLLRGYYEC